MALKKPKLPVWSDLLLHADQELMSFALLYNAGLHGTAMMHAGQAVEKYLKALALSGDDPDSSTLSTSQIWKLHRPIGQASLDSQG